MKRNATRTEWSVEWSDPITGGRWRAGRLAIPTVSLVEHQGHSIPASWVDSPTQAPSTRLRHVAAQDK